MLINEVPYEESKTDCIFNCLRIEDIRAGFPGYYKLSYMKKMHKKFGNISSKQIFKEVFGRQQRCVNYTHRNWIWTFSNEEKTATIHCLVSETGVSWEMNNTSNVKEILKLRKEIERKIIE